MRIQGASLLAVFGPLRHLSLSSVADWRRSAFSLRQGTIRPAFFLVDLRARNAYHDLSMHIPLTRYGLPEVVVYPAAVLSLMAAGGLFGPAWLPLWCIVAVEGIFSLILAWALMFFRDPHREPPHDDSLLLAPADGTITNVERVEDAEFIGGPALRVGIFLSIFNTHINRAPCDVRVESITHRPGKYLNAMSPQAGKVNESNNVAMIRTGHPQDRLLVRQISGAIARRIVCAAKEGQQLAGGEQFGMIKFGSRTELYLSASENVVCMVRIGDKVKAGITPLVKYGPQPPHRIHVSS
jgi:phosphatidylserine decarboxylase